MRHTLPLLLFIGMLLQGCGQKGALYLPEEQTEEEAATPVAAEYLQP